MDKYTLVSAVLEAPKLKEFLDRAVNNSDYKEKGRKITAYVLMQYFLLAAVMQVDSYRELSQLGQEFRIPNADYSTLSKKAGEVPYTLALQVCQSVLDSSCRAKRRKLKKESEMLLKAVDSTRITACAGKWTWAPYLRESSGLKFHVAYLPELGLPAQIEVSPINVGDTAHLTSFQDKTTVLVCDRGYMNIEKFLSLDKAGQKFVIRLRNTVRFQKERATGIDCLVAYTDQFCTLSKHREVSKEAREREYRVIKFVGANGEDVILCTNIRDISADTIAGMYKDRWNIECFFRTLKQNFTIKRLFGTTANAAYTQGLVAFIAYVLLYNVHERIQFACKKKASKAVAQDYQVFSHFLRTLRLDCLSNFPIKLSSVRNSLLP